MPAIRGRDATIGVQISQQAAVRLTVALVGTVIVAAIAFLPLDPSRYHAAIAAIGAIATVGAVGLAVVGLAADHSRQRSDATLNFLNSALDEDRERVARVNRWLNDSGVRILTAEQASDLRSLHDLRPLRDDLRAYLNHLERLAFGVRTGIFDAQVVEKLARSRIVNARHRYAAYLDAAASGNDLTGTRVRNFEHLVWLVDEKWDGPAEASLRRASTGASTQSSRGPGDAG